MSFWNTSGYTYHQFVDLPREKAIILLHSFSRSDIIEWLSWNDPNGIYEDEISLKEFGNLLSLEEGLEIMIRQLEENRIDTPSR